MGSASKATPALPWEPRAGSPTPPMPGHLDVVEGLNPSFDGDQEPGNTINTYLHMYVNIHLCALICTNRICIHAVYLCSSLHTFDSEPFMHSYVCPRVQLQTQ